MARFSGGGAAPARARKPARAKRMTRDEVAAMFARFRDAMPDPRTELHYENPFTLLVAVVLSAQATDAGVNKATPALFALAPTPEKMAALGVDRVESLIKTIGLYRTKARNVV
ncbi:MAG: endonuclease III, partial [Rhizobiales bacterium]|nr:endonuclease III [Hyphomicrobiales bacterium]